MVRQEVVVQQEAMQQPTGQVGGKSVLRGGCFSKGIGRTVATVG
jgi:hypothetical protein